ncbi:TetR family transcriptional regulator [Streptomyces sp. NPDC019990]|uniref:TetR/AcrR family transcriptional regulator n=1 Tax=Streptomyces sp. NPDC019990 TaxID=3154693 RepID=UPI0033E99A65
MEIARAAAGLFARHGLRATRAEDIAQAAGIAPRTFYRYFATKEEAVAPLYAAGAQRWVEAVRAAPAEVSVFEALRQGIRHALPPGTGVAGASWEWVRPLLCLAEANPSLRRVWADVCQTSERMLGEVLTERVTRAGGAEGSAAPDGADNVAAAPEPGPAAPEPGPAAPEPGLPTHEPHLPAAPEPHLPAPEPHLPAPEPRFAAAVACAAVRAALEGWAAGEGPVEGPGSPAELALRNLAALRDFPWGP